MQKYITILAILLLMLSCNGSSNQKQSRNVTPPSGVETIEVGEREADDYQFLVRVGDEAPDFRMQLPEGDSVSLSSLHGKVVMLQFTASWCGVCRKEMPYIESEIWQRHKHNPSFALYGIDREEPVEKVKELVNATGVTYPIGLDPDASIFGRYAEKEAGITRNVIIDREGKIVMLTRLFKEEEFNHMVQVIDSLLLDN
ncbi:MAG TPA: TlpA disulfide reductase family protein [Proteiniphilum sp.]|nr:TlpA disulfide reductase family protein [Proteiniphilum sp.]HPJ49460.1 TlpA disulfide reductase family protein [Proteiniphilum sp.]HPR20427.1 TlpA disulfide reductase family protein [Proteiniphilum sp.]